MKQSLKKKEKTKKTPRTSSSLGSARWSVDRWGPHRQPPSAPPAASRSSLPAPTTHRKGFPRGRSLILSTPHNLPNARQRAISPRYFIRNNTNYRDNLGNDFINMGREGNMCPRTEHSTLIGAQIFRPLSHFFTHVNSTGKCLKAASLIFGESSGRWSLFDKTDGRT